jgi:hypothetical protein
MKIRDYVLLILLVPMLTGCKTATAPLPAWAPNQAVAVAGYAIASANAAVVQYEKDAAAGFVPSATLRSVMSGIQQALSVAQPAFDEWEAALKSAPETAEPAALTSAVQTISTDLAKLPAAAGGTQ